MAQIQEASTMGVVVRSIPKINAALEDHQEEYQPTMVEFEVKVFNQTVSIFIDPRANLNYIRPKVVEQCHLQYVKFKIPWLVQLTTGAKRRCWLKSAISLRN